ncbi:orotate phosphoribosyltransferase [Deefgea tanakiae]|uniref:Orotate phosphoribosyltransferase n=1 Tax=Deefgea tanakiae TaxID=2865840 RepID=A0ABX8Z4Z9_9NEIS|nr:orotate phosphoribosyltransferase [Deefgea tanakiae]QZA77643.1 orotate phosphoribosyltransferase [Deefgea tanakiae]
MTDFRRDFIQFAVDSQVLCFGDFITKAGRASPYFFNAGLFSDGTSVGELARFYAQAALASGVQFDILFGPAYKGIVLASATAVALANAGHNVPFVFNRKEAKDHGEGGVLVGAPLKGRVMIIDDVISAGTSVRESVKIIRDAGAEPAGVLIALDRMERGQGTLSAVQEVEQSVGIPVIPIASLQDLLGFLAEKEGMTDNLTRVQNYRNQYGIE